MTAQILDFSITDLNRQIVSGSHEKLYQKNNEGFLVSSEDSTIIELTLKILSIVKTIQIKIIRVQKLNLYLLSQNHEINAEQNRFSRDDQKVYLLDFPTSIKKRTKYIRITIGGLEETLIGIKYIIIKGERLNNKLLASNMKNKSDISFDQPKRSPHAILQKASNTVFAERIKYKQKQRQVIGRQTQDDQLKRVLQISKRQAQRIQGNHNYKQKNKQKQFVIIQEDTIALQSQAVKNYNKVDYNSCKDIFKFVNTKWLQAQKKAQIEFGINKEERLSQRITIKHLYNKLILIDMPNSQKKLHLQRLAVMMGAKLTQELKEYCILVTTRSDTERVAKARKLGNISIVNPQFIEQCHQCDALLNIKDYFIKL